MKKPKTVKALEVLSSATTQAVVPPPNRTEVIEAMAQMEHDRLTAEYEAEQRRQDDLEMQIAQAMAAYLETDGSHLLRTGSISYYGRDTTLDFRVELNIKQLPADIRQMIKEMGEPSYRGSIPSLAEIRRKIREGIRGGGMGKRVKALLESPEAREALTQLLDEVKKNRDH